LADVPESPVRSLRLPLDPVLLTVACIWGAGNLVTKWLLEVMDPAALLAVRMGTVAVLMAGLLLASRRPRLAHRDWLMLVLVGGGIVAIQLLSFNYAMRMTTGSEGSLLISTAPVWTAVLVTLLGMERLTRVNWLGVALASAGVAMLVLGGAGRTFEDAPARVPGDLLMLGSAWLYGGFMGLSKRWMRRIGPLHVVCYSFAASGVILALVGARPLLDTDWTAITAGRWVGIAYLAVMAGFLGVVLWYSTIGRTTASGTAVYQYLVPGVSCVGAALFLGERMAPVQIAGIFVMLAGVYLARATEAGPT
jgi:drug/metabolite transporter (DMT)-like permease